MRSSSGGASTWRRSDAAGGSGELSRVSAATTASTASARSVSGGGRGASFLDAFRSCFALQEERSPDNSMSDDFHPSHQLSQSMSSQGSNSWSTFGSRRSIKGMYSPMHRNSLGRETPGSTKFSLPQIQKATKNFSPNLKIGQGGSGTVYKGQLADGTLVAVKRAKKNVYDKHMGREFWNEIETLQRIEHLNLVRFHGYLEFGGEQLIIVEYVPNGNLREHLDCVNGKVLEFSVRLEIAIDVAHAITYLHTYSDPEYLRTYQLNEKSDVYSFGVLLVELVTGRRPIEPKRSIIERVTAKWSMEKFVEGNAIQTLDANLESNDAINLAVEKIYELALQCLAPTKRNRPSMRRCAEILWSIRKDYRELVVPTSAMN
nr:unnamed protein product [Digitaria exilis]